MHCNETFILSLNHDLLDILTYSHPTSPLSSTKDRAPSPKGNKPNSKSFISYSWDYVLMYISLKEWVKKNLEILIQHCPVGAVHGGVPARVRQCPHWSPAVSPLEPGSVPNEPGSVPNGARQCPRWPPRPSPRSTAGRREGQCNINSVF